MEALNPKLGGKPKVLYHNFDLRTVSLSNGVKDSVHTSMHFYKVYTRVYTDF